MSWCPFYFILVSEAAAVSHKGDKSQATTLSVPEGQRKTEAAGLKAIRASESKGGQIKPLTKIKLAILLRKNISHGSGSFESSDREEMSRDQWCHYGGRSGFSHSERSAETQHSTSLAFGVQKCMLTDMSRQRKLRAHRVWTMWHLKGWYWYLHFQINFRNSAYLQ